jgi:glycosyltransferase involved in cell wall biosynthesis
MAAIMPNTVTGVVVIGRNEGERFSNCINSLEEFRGAKVYVDSGSTDSSVQLAKKAGYQVVELDMSRPFTAGRARNEGFTRLLELSPNLDYVQFVDGDCIVSDGWLSPAQGYLDESNKAAIVCGRRKEIDPQASIYSQLCDIEWDTPIGTVLSCGGDFMVRVEAFKSVEGFNSSVIAGEEPELCFRLRQKQWLIERVDLDMTYHDADMHRFSQYWNRAKRSGHAYAQGVAMHGCSVERFQVRETLSIVLWALIVPLVIVIGSLLLGALAWWGLLVYPLMWIKIYHFRRVLSPQISPRIVRLYACLILVGKFAQLTGMITFLKMWISQSQFKIIEYK